ncbi:MAG TPA: arginase, partial [Microbacteriaceae bacterium]|nr:arginase [Microbacteriaceae bacterium]
MAATFLVVPQWQGSGSSRAMRLVDGAEAILGDLPGASTVSVEIPLGAGSDEGTLVNRLSAIQSVRDAQLTALGAVRGLAVTIGGDCGVELAAIQHAAGANDGMAVVWLDAHPDLHTPETSPSRAFHGMVLRTLLGEGEPSLIP